MEKFILFGGSFDPIHLGHIKAVEFAKEKLHADKVILIPAKRSPLKQSAPMASDIDRLHMMELAIIEAPDIFVSDCEFNRAEPSYTYDTIKSFRSEYGEDIELFWLAGADVLTELQHWYRADELLRMCQFVIVHRPGFPLPDFSSLREYFDQSTVDLLQENVLEMPLVDISSTEIRRLAVSGQLIDSMVAKPVADYINQNNLYSSCH